MAGAVLHVLWLAPLGNSGSAWQRRMPGQVSPASMWTRPTASAGRAVRAPAPTAFSLPMPWLGVRTTMLIAGTVSCGAEPWREEAAAACDGGSLRTYLQRRDEARHVQAVLRADRCSCCLVLAE